MRYDLLVYWVEDTPTWANSEKDIMRYELQDLGIMVDFKSESNADTAKAEIANSCKGFKKYDLFFIDYNISSDIDGQAIINSLRQNNVDVDILFYSADREKEIRTTISQNLSDFEGVYVANRNTFHEKALALIEKNSRKLLSIQNIRGKLMDCTSENDFIIKSYILEKFPKLDDEPKMRVVSVINEYMKNSIVTQIEQIESECRKIDESGISKIKDFMDLPSFIVPLELKYTLFEEIAKELGENATIQNYFNNVVKKRNVLAHKKLDICDNLDHIKYCDTLKQFKNRACNTACDQCTGEFSITVNEWEQIRKDTNAFTLIFDGMLSKL